MCAMNQTTLRASGLAISLAFSHAALAVEPPGADPSPPGSAVPLDTSTPAVTETPPAPKPTPPAYSLPWQLRPAAAANVVRSDTSSGMRTVAGNGGTTVVTLLLA